MAWLDAVLLSAFSAFLVMSVLSVLLPAARPDRQWGGIGLAWLVAIAAVAIVGLANRDKWTLDCAFGTYRISVTGGIAMGDQSPCTGTNQISPWLLALPPTLGILILLSWVWRHTAPASTAFRVSVVLVLATLAVVLVGQVDPNLGLLLAVLIVVAGYAWPWVRDAFGGMNPRPGAT